MKRLSCLPFLGAALLGGLLSPPALASAPGRRAWLEGGPFRPYDFNRAVLASESVLRGRIEARGRRWDGSEAALFEAELDAATTRADLAFYLDEDFRSLSIRAPEAGLELEVELAGAGGFGAAAGEEEEAVRDALRALIPPPPPSSRSGFARAARLPLGGLVLQAAAYRAVGFFARPPRALPLAALGAAALLAAVAAALPRKDGRRGRASIALGLGGSLGLALGICLAAPPPELFRARFPAGAPEAALSGALERRVERNHGFLLVEYSPAESQAGADLVLLPSCEGGRGIPLDSFAPALSRSRFSSPPLVTSGEVGFLVRAEDGAIGWVLDAGR